jgi:hypothetical protein
VKVRLVLALWVVAGGAAAAETCALDANSAPQSPLVFSGVARGPATAQEIASQTGVANARVRAPMSPKYAGLPRAFVYFTMGGVRHGTIAAVVDGVMPKPGEAVVVASRRRDPDLPCAFIPWTVRRGTPGTPTS